MASIFQGLRQCFSHFLLFLLLVFVYILVQNAFIVKMVPILYITPIISMVFFKNEYKFLFFGPLIFVFGLIEDLLCSRVLGVSAIFCLIFFNVIELVIAKFPNRIAKYITILVGLSIYGSWEIISLIYLRSSNYVEQISISDTIIFQAISLVSTSLILSIIYLRRGNERDKKIKNRFKKIATI